MTSFLRSPMLAGIVPPIPESVRSLYGHPNDGKKHDDQEEKMVRQGDKVGEAANPTRETAVPNITATQRTRAIGGDQIEQWII